MSVHAMPIGDIVEKVTTWNPAKQANGEFDYIDLSAVDQNDKRIATPNRIPATEAPSRARQIVRAGDVLVSTVRPNLNGVAKVVDAHDGMTASTGFCVLRPNQRHLDTNYLFQWVKSPAFVSDMMRKATGASYPAISDRIVKDSEIPLPPLDEQKRIAAILDKADQLRQKRRQAIALLDSLTQSIFVEMFGVPNPTFENVLLGDVCSTIRDGAHATPKYVESGIPFVTVRNITSGSVSFEGAKYVSHETHAELTKRVKPERGDILVSKDGTIGIPCLVETDEEFSIFVSVALLKPIRSLVNPAFLSTQLGTESVQRQIREYSKGVAIRHLHLTDFRRLKIILPELEIQEKFVARARQIQDGKRQLANSLTGLDSLFSSLQHRAFSGQL